MPHLPLDGSLSHGVPALFGAALSLLPLEHLRWRSSRGAVRPLQDIAEKGYRGQLLTLLWRIGKPGSTGRYDRR